MFTAQLDSRFINYYSSTRHFKEADKVIEYGATLQHEIESNLTVCDRQLYIFDEARRYPPKLLDSLAQYFDQGSPQSSKAARSVFMFIYEGDEPVVEWAIELNRGGINRDDITLRQAEERLVPYVMGDESLQESTLVRNGLIQHHLPFLPLEQAHVRRCIRDAILSSGKRPTKEDLEEMIDTVHSEVVFYHEETFSTFGCKKITSKVRALLDQ